MTDRSREIWEDFGVNDAYYSVLTFEKYRKANLNEAAMADFFLSGREHVASVLDVFERHFHLENAPGRAIDYGCGVGRVLLPLAERCGSVVGVDISHAMLSEARSNADRLGLENFELQNADGFLQADDERYDLVHSYIVLQHIDPATGYELIRIMIERLNPGGVGMFHVSYFDPSPRLRKLRVRVLRDLPVLNGVVRAIRGSSGPLMPMYEYDLEKVFRILQGNSCGEVLVRFSDHGMLGAMIFFRKQLEVQNS